MNGFSQLVAEAIKRALPILVVLVLALALYAVWA